jgi:hypothetical protein
MGKEDSVSELVSSQLQMSQTFGRVHCSSSVMNFILPIHFLSNAKRCIYYCCLLFLERVAAIRKGSSVESLSYLVENCSR